MRKKITIKIVSISKVDSFFHKKETLAYLLASKQACW